MLDVGRKKPFQVVALTDRGRVRPENEDSVGAELCEGGRAAVAVVADGVGGEPCGALASRLAVDAILEAADGGVPRRGVRGWMEAAVEAANRQVRKQQGARPGAATMATTLVALVVRPHVVTVASLGDSRAYRFRGGALEQLTSDHTVAQALANDEPVAEGSAGAVGGHLLTHALGLTEPAAAATRNVRRRRGDIFLLCSDGLSGALSGEVMARILAEEPGLRTKAETLVRTANAAGGPDNISVVLIGKE